MDTWKATDARQALRLADARLQLHHAAQFGTALGISYLPKEPDDSHTNLGWIADLGALMSHEVRGEAGAVALGVRARDLSLLVTRNGTVVSTIALHGITNVAATQALLPVLAAEGLDPARFILARHYDLPQHAVANGAPYDALQHESFRALGDWLGNASIELERVARTVPQASGVRLWPHHFDIATLVSVGPGASTGAGLALGDGYYDEPYFYVNAHPQPQLAQLTDPLAGGGTWHTHDWIGAVLPGSRVTGDAAAQQAQARAYLDASLAACRKLVSA
ncbi:MAG: hypothetical protein ABJE47_10800 [bacterium]